MQKLLNTCLICFLFTNTICGQNNVNTNLSGDVFSKNHISLGFFSTFSKANTEILLGKLEPGTRYRSGYNISFNYIFNINKTYGIKSGIIAGVHPLYYELDYSAEEYDLPWDTFIYETFYSGHVSFPLQMVYRYQLFKKTLLTSDIGFSFNSFLYSGINHGFGVGGLNTPSVDILEINGEYDINLKLNYNFGIGVLRILKNYNMLKFSIMYKYSPYTIFDGKYYLFREREDVSIGKFTSTGSYLAIEIAYIFTGQKK